MKRKLDNAHVGIIRNNNRFKFTPDIALEVRSNPTRKTRTHLVADDCTAFTAAVLFKNL